MLHKLIAASLLTIALLAVPVSAHDDPGSEPFEASCTVHYGTGIPGVGTVGFSVLENSFGSCTLDEVDETVSVHEIDAAAGCTIEFDDDGDSVFDGEVQLDGTYEPGTRFSAFCEVGVINGENALTLHTVLEEA